MEGLNTDKEHPEARWVFLTCQVAQDGTRLEDCHSSRAGLVVDCSIVGYALSKNEGTAQLQAEGAGAPNST